MDSRVATHISVTVPGQRCLDALALASEEVARLELLAEDENGRIFARGRQKGPNRSLLFCAGEQDQELRLVIRPHAGRGLAVLAVSTTRSRQDRLDLNPAIPVEYLSTGDAAKSDPPLPPPRTVKRLSLRVGELSSWEMRLNGCSRLDLIPDAALVGYAARVWKGDGSLLSATRGKWEGPMFACAKGSVRIEAEATRRGGTLLMEVRETAQVPGALLGLPLAASRLLARMQVAGVIRFADGVSMIEQVSLQESKLHASEFIVPRGRCLQVFVAKDQGGFGVEARMLEQDSGLDLAFARGGTGLQLSACAPAGTPVSGSLQVRTVRGSAPALIAFAESLPNEE